MLTLHDLPAWPASFHADVFDLSDLIGTGESLGGLTYHTLRMRIGRSILLGLEFPVTADIVRTVAVTPTFRSLGVLAGTVVIRTFLSFSLEVVEAPGDVEALSDEPPGEEGLDDRQRPAA